MDIFHHRPLFSCCAVFMLFSVAGLPLDLTGKCILGGVFLAGILLYVCLCVVRRRNGYRATLAVIAGILACLALFLSHRHFQSRDAAYIREHEHETLRVEATVTDRHGAGGYLTSYNLWVDTVNGEPIEGLAVLTCHYVSHLRPGQEIILDAAIIPLSDAAGDGYDAVALMGDGYIMGLLSEEETTVTVIREDSDSLMVRAGNLRRALAARLNLLTGKESHGLPSALLLGDRSALSDSVRRDFARSGVSHLLAISGLHMTLLFGMLEIILLLCHVPKRVRSVVLILGAVGYLILLGFPPSATRAAIMLGMAYLSYLASAESDSLTSLGLAGACILAVTPYAVVDAGFWMSFLATLGLVTCLPSLNQWMSNKFVRSELPPWRQVLRADLIKCVSAVLVGIIAMSFTLSVVAAVIGEMSILSPIATILLTPLCAATLILSLLCLPLAGTRMGYLVGSLVEDVCGLMINLTARMADFSWTVISLRHPAVVPLTAGILVLTLLMLVVRLPDGKKRLVMLPMLIGWMALGGILTAHHALTADEVQVSYLQPSTASDALVMVSSYQGFVCDLSNGSLSSMTAAAMEAKQQGATELAVCMLTHYHARTSGSLATLLERETVRALWMPTPANGEELDFLLACLEKADAAGVPVSLYDPGEALQVFGGGRLMLETARLDRSVQPVLLVSLDVSADETGKDRLVYCGSAVFESALSHRAACLVSEADAVIFGNHGPLCKQPFGGDLDLSDTAEIVLSAHGDVAALFERADLSAETPLWLGQKRMILERD